MIRSTTKPAIKVASYNIRKALGTDRVRRPERILAVLAELDADVVALQEADRRYGLRQSALPLELLGQSDWRAVDFAIRPGGIGWHGNAILVRTGIEIAACRPLALPVLEPRGAVMAELDAGGFRFRMIGMHLDLSGLWRRKQARALIAHVDDCAQPLPTILMGDLNEWSLADGCLADFARRFDFAPTGPSFHARRPLARLDRIMTTPDLAVLQSGTHHSQLAARASDHLPIWAEIGLR